MIKFSVIIPVYNREKYIEKCIDSVLNQSYSNFEIIVINDGSTDNTLKIIKNKAKLDKRIRYLTIDNGGPSMARNYGIKIATGEYLVFLDSDDYFNLNYLEEIDEMIDAHPVDLVLCGYKIHDNKLNIKEISFNNNIVIDEEKNILKHFKQLYELGLINTLCNKIFKKEVLLKNKLEMNVNLSLSEDTQFVLEYFKVIDSIFISNKSYYNVIKIDEDSLTKKYNPNQKEIFENILLNINTLYIFRGKDFLEDKEELFYFCWLETVKQTIFSFFHRNCEKNFFEKYKEIKKLLIDSRTQEAIELKKVNQGNQFLNFVIKIQSPLIIIFLIYIIKLKKYLQTIK